MKPNSKLFKALVVRHKMERLKADSDKRKLSPYAAWDVATQNKLAMADYELRPYKPGMFMLWPQ